MAKKLITWSEVKKDMDTLTAEDWAEINLQVNIVGELLRARENERLSQRALGEKCGIHQPMIARIENGDTDPQLTTILKLLRPLGKTLAIVDIEGGDLISKV
jgi:predicted transcriptional regulator